MLKPAQLYRDQLKKKDIESWYDMDNIYCHGWTGTSVVDLADNNYDRHVFVSVDKNDDVIGYITYAVDWQAMSADRFSIVSYRKGNLEFMRDLWQAVCDLFEKYHMNRIDWCCYADNPAIRGYRNFIKKHGGRECGYKKQTTKLMDGNMHDSVEFEIMADEFHKNKYELYDCQDNVGIDQAEKIVNEVEAEYNNGWIPVSERMPEESVGKYLTQNKYGMISVYDYCCGWNCFMQKNGIINREYEIRNIVAWQPLPELYRG